MHKQIKLTESSKIPVDNPHKYVADVIGVGEDTILIINYSKRNYTVTYITKDMLSDAISASKYTKARFERVYNFINDEPTNVDTNVKILVALLSDVFEITEHDGYSPTYFKELLSKYVTMFSKVGSGAIEYPLLSETRSKEYHNLREVVKEFRTAITAYEDKLLSMEIDEISKLLYNYLGYRLEVNEEMADMVYRSPVGFDGLVYLIESGKL